ncbi:hypothetical protein ACKWTF_010459 [Chironomus riparius]
MNMKSAKGYERFGLRVTAYSEMGNRKYMEDVYSVAYQKTNDGSELDFAYFGMFDGHGGDTAAIFAKNHLMNFIVDQPGFWSNDDEDVLKAIKTGFLDCHMAMWRDLDNWKPTNSGLPSTAGTTASIAFIRKGKLYIGHAGDSGIILGTESSEPGRNWVAEPLTVDHKPENREERKRIEEAGGKVIEKIGIHRVVWYRPRFPHQGPIRRNTRIEEIPFLAVARSLGDLWSYNWKTDKFMVSPEPDVAVYEIDSSKHRCLIFASDGLWNIMDGQTAVDLVYEAEASNDQNAKMVDKSAMKWLNPSRHLVEIALRRWRENKMRSDNTSVVCVMLDVPNKMQNIGNIETEQNSRTIYDYSTSEAYNLDYVDMSAYDVHPNFNLVMQSPHQVNPYPYYNHYENNPHDHHNPNQLPSFSVGYHTYSHTTYLDHQRASSSSDLTYHTSSNERAFVKGCCPNERFLLAKADEQIHYHATFDQHKEMYQSMAQQPFPPLHYAYRPVPNHSFGFSLPPINDNSFLQNQNFMSPRPMERYNYLRPTEAEIAEMHNEINREEEEEELSDTDTEEMEWSDDEKQEKETKTDIATSVDADELEINKSDVEPENPKTDLSIQIFEISSSNLGINEKLSANKTKNLPERSNNKENSETHDKKKKSSKNRSTGRYYETRQTNCKMRSGNIRSSGIIQKTIGKEKSQRRIVRCARRAVKAFQDMKASTSLAIKKQLESIANVKSRSKVQEKNTSSDSRILRSSQSDVKSSPPANKKEMKEKVFKVNIIRNLRSNAVYSEKTRKKNTKSK